MPPTTPIANLRLLLDAGSPAWIPFSLDVGAISGLSEPVARRFRSITGADEPAEYFDADVRRFSLAASFGGDDPAALHGSVEPGTTFDEWGNGHWVCAAGNSKGKGRPSLVGYLTKPSRRAVATAWTLSETPII